MIDTLSNMLWSSGVMWRCILTFDKRGMIETWYVMKLITFCTGKLLRKKKRTRRQFINHYGHVTLGLLCNSLLLYIIFKFTKML